MLSTSCLASQMKVSPETTTRNVLNGHLMCQAFSRLCRLYSLQFVSSLCLSLLNLSFSMKKENVDIYIYFSYGLHINLSGCKNGYHVCPRARTQKKILYCAERSEFRILAAPLLQLYMQICDEHFLKLRYMMFVKQLNILVVFFLEIFVGTMLRYSNQVLADIPNSQRFDILKALITNTDSSSMVIP